MFKIDVSTAFGIEAVTKRELAALGYNETAAVNGRITVEGGYDAIANLNLNLRTAERVFLQIAKFKCETFDELFENIKNISIEDFVTQDANIVINAKSAKSKLFALSAIQSITKKAVCERLMKKFKTGALSESGAQYCFELAVMNDNATLSLDTSGAGLHKRGYRQMVGAAPLRETLAAAIINLSVFKWDKPLIDPFCGSGTIPIEAALIAQNIAPGLNRNFAFENWNNFPKHHIALARENSRARIVSDRELRISGFDIDPAAIKLANFHAEKAGVKVHFQSQDMRKISSRYSYGVMIANPPYGERLMEEEKEIRLLYKDFYKVFKSFDNWSLYIITANRFLEKYFGEKADKNRKIFNSQLECKLYSYMGEKPKKF